jgi:hypothetical protein
LSGGAERAKHGASMRPTGEPPMPEPAPEPVPASAGAADQPGARQVLLVLGMHRSGTSAAAGLLTLLGAAMARTPMPATAFNPKGYWESVPLARLHDRLLAEAGSAWDDWGPLDPGRIAAAAGGAAAAALAETFVAEYGDAPLVVLKDPRICRFVPLWRQAFARLGARPKAVIPLRHPLEVARSLERRDGMPLETALLVWLRHCLEAERATRDLPRCLFAFDDLMADWQGVADRIAAELDLAWPVPPAAAAAEADAFLSAGLRHHVLAADEAALGPAGPACAGWVATTVAALGTLARSGGRDAAAEARLDAVLAGLDAADPLAGALARRAEAATAVVRARAEAAAAELDAARGVARAAAGAARAAQAQAAAARRHAEAAAAAEAARARTEARAVAAETRAAATQAALAAAEATAAGLEAERAQAAARAARLETALAAREAEIAALVGSTSWRLTAPLRRVGSRLRRARPDGGA